MCVPSGVTGVEKRAVEEATLSAGARQAYLIEEPMAAAIGAGLPVAEPTGNMIVDVGGGTTEVAVISLGGIVVSQSLRVGGDEMDEAIINHIKREYKLLIGQQTAEEIKLEIGSAYDMREELQAEVRGRDMLTGLPKTVVLSSEEVRRALDEPVQQIIEAIKSTLDKTPPELAADIMDRGIVMAGGGALLSNFDERLRHETQMPVHLAESPLTCVAVGLRAQPRGVRGDPPERQGAPKQPPALTPANLDPLVPRNRSVSAVLGSSVPRPRPQPFPSRNRSTLRRRARGGSSRAALARPDHDLLPLEPSGGALHGVEGAGATVLRPFEVAAERVARPFRDVYGYFAGLVHVKRENSRLQAEVNELRAAGAAGRSPRCEQNRELRDAAEVRRQPALPERLHAGEHADHFAGRASSNSRS